MSCLLSLHSSNHTSLCPGPKEDGKINTDGNCKSVLQNTANKWWYIGGISNLLLKVYNPCKSTISLLLVTSTRCQHFIRSDFMHRKLNLKLFDKLFKIFVSSKIFENKNKKEQH